MFRLTFALGAIAVLSLMNWYSYKRFLKRLGLFSKIQPLLKWLMIAMSLCKILYFLVLRLDTLNSFFYALFSSFIGLSFMLFCVALIYDLMTYRDWETDRKSTRLNSSHRSLSRMPSSA